MEQLIGFLLAWISTLSGVALGGFMVFKTKREHYEGGLFSGEQKGESFNVDDELSDLTKAMEDSTSAARLPAEVETANDAFVDQFAENLAQGVPKS
ncbi:MAG: hypothetical protein JEZ12_13140 [Desulfobacterium sp.]|nr:hypothetical protein [Desulfobacterium sp.]